MPIQFERLSLYEEVWSEPLTRLGKKYGLSDNGVRKACIALNIPLPKAGHWAKIAAGHQLPRTPLPKNSKITVYVSHPKPVEPLSQEKTEDAIWLEQQESFELDPINHIVVELQPKKFHPLLLETSSRLIEKVKESEKLIIEAQKEANRPIGKVWAPNLNSSSLRYFQDRGQLLELHRWDMPFRFTLKTWHRGLAIVNTMFLAAESRGFEIIKEKESNKLSFNLDDGLVYIRMSEELKQDVRVLKNPSEPDLRLGPEHIKVPTGTLRFHFCASGSTSEVEVPDTDDKPLQENLNQVFCRIYKLIVKSRVHGWELDAWRRKYEEERRQQEEREKIRQEELRLQEIVLQKRKDLLKEANDWQSAELIYKYVAHFDALENFQENESFLEWKKWALNVANELDPTSVILKRTGYF
ncbi:MAG: hypothetical protein ACXW11_10810 [Methylotenera sp.]